MTNGWGVKYNSNNRPIQCQVCGFKRKLNEVFLVSDKYNKYHGKLICRDHYNKTNPQIIQSKIKEKLIANKNKINPVSYTPYTNPNDDRLPGKPTNGRTATDPNDGHIILYWDAPGDNGSSAIKGYRIRYSNPQRIHYAVLTEDSLTGVPYFKDTVNINTDSVSYTVAAINGFGIGPESDEFYYPKDEYNTVLIHGEQYLAYLGTDGYYRLVTVDGQFVKIEV